MENRIEKKDLQSEIKKIEEKLDSYYLNGFQKNPDMLPSIQALEQRLKYLQKRARNESRNLKLSEKKSYNNRHFKGTAAALLICASSILSNIHFATDSGIIPSSHLPETTEATFEAIDNQIPQSSKFFSDVIDNYKTVLKFNSTPINELSFEDKQSLEQSLNYLRDNAATRKSLMQPFLHDIKSIYANSRGLSSPENIKLIFNQESNFTSVYIVSNPYAEVKSSDTPFEVLRGNESIYVLNDISSPQNINYFENGSLNHKGKLMKDLTLIANESRSIYRSLSKDRNLDNEISKRENDNPKKDNPYNLLDYRKIALLNPELKIKKDTQETERE